MSSSDEPCSVIGLMKYSEAKEKAKNIDASLKSDDPRFRYAVHVVFIEGTTTIHCAAFATKNKDFTYIFTEHYGHHVLHNDNIKFITQYKDIPIEILNQNFHIMFGEVDNIEGENAHVTLVDPANQQRYHAIYNYGVLKTLYGVDRKFRVISIGNKILIEPIRNTEPIPESRVRQIIAGIEKITENDED